MPPKSMLQFFFFLIERTTGQLRRMVGQRLCKNFKHTTNREVYLITDNPLSGFNNGNLARAATLVAYEK